jgi:type VI protein secretion system component Hcp
MKSKESAKSKKQSVVVKDLNAKKDPKGGEGVALNFTKVEWSYTPTKTLSVGGNGLK